MTEKFRCGSKPFFYRLSEGTNALMNAPPSLTRQHYAQSYRIPTIATRFTFVAPHLPPIIFF